MENKFPGVKTLCLIGEGSFGQVFKVIDNETKTEVALKVIQKVSNFAEFRLIFNCDLRSIPALQSLLGAQNFEARGEDPSRPLAPTHNPNDQDLRDRQALFYSN